MDLVISQGVRRKLSEKHNIQINEIYECFANREGTYIEDIREDHKTDPPTLWFIAETDYGKKLKVVFIQDENDFIIKTAYIANDQEIRIYTKYA